MPSYTEYLKIDELLALQRPLSEGPEHDEMLFIVIHQVYELWFKEILHELDHLERMLRGTMAPGRGTRSSAILTILKVMVAQLDILETMTPLEFLSFRDRLESGSGFQSYQFRRARVRAGLEGREGAGALSRPGARAPRALERRLASAHRCGTPSCTTSPPTACAVPRPTSSATSPGRSSPLPRSARS